jgi:predicted O-linked N-acetylglucosamine transferase (SPINDLY family)
MPSQPPDLTLAKLQRLLQQNPANPVTWRTASDCLATLGRNDEAINAMCRALVLQPGDPDGHNNLGRLLLFANRNQEAEASFRRALILAPSFHLAQLNLGQTLLRLGRLGEARQALESVVAANPDDHAAQALLGLALSRAGLSDQALIHCRRSVNLNPQSAFNWEVLGGVLDEISEVNEAEAAFDRALQLQPSLSIQLQKALMLPIIPTSHEEMAAWRSRLEREIDRLQASGLAIDDPILDVRTTLFYAAYHGQNDRHLHQRLAAFYLSACPQLGWEAPHCRPGSAPAAPGGKIRLGVLSSYFHHHIISILFRGLIAQLDRNQFEVVVFYVGSPDTLNQSLHKDAETVICLEGGLAAMQQQVAEQRLDVLLYPDIGMAPATYFLAFARLAPVQCVQAGHPVTTGIPNLDYFLSAQALEPEDADDHYSERLIRLRHFPIYYPKPTYPQGEDILARLGIPASGHLYACPQTIFKLHPDFDWALIEVLRRDPSGRLILIEGKEKNWTTRLKARLQAAGPDVAERIYFVPQLPFDDFMSLIAAADVLLDPFHFGGGTTTLAAFAIGAPIVTLPGAMLRGRSTQALYRTMGIVDLIVADQEDYVALAGKLAHDRDWRNHLSEQIAARNDVLYATDGAIREMEQFFIQAVTASHQGHLTTW